MWTDGLNWELDTSSKQVLVIVTLLRNSGNHVKNFSGWSQHQGTSEPSCLGQITKRVSGWQSGNIYGFQELKIEREPAKTLFAPRAKWEIYSLIIYKHVRQGILFFFITLWICCILFLWLLSFIKNPNAAFWSSFTNFTARSISFSTPLRFSHASATILTSAGSYMWLALIACISSTKKF